MPILVVALLAGAEVILSLRLRHLPAYSVEELNQRQPNLNHVGLLARSMPLLLFGLGIIVIMARVGRRLTIDQAVLAMLALLLLWALSSAIIELRFGLTYRLVRRRRLPGETTPVKPEQYRLGPEVAFNGRYRLGIWFIAVIMIIIMLL